MSFVLNNSSPNNKIMPDLTSKCGGWREHLEVDEVFSSGDFAGRGQAAYLVVRNYSERKNSYENNLAINGYIFCYVYSFK